MSGTLKPLKILLTNDDGIHARGLWALYHALKSDHDPVVVAPDRERSAVGHGITLHKPLRAHKVKVNSGDEGWAVTGTPADCVKLSMIELLDGKPDLVVSGINPGANTGVNMNYSGTVAAAKEASLYGVPALAVSIQGGDHPAYETAARFIQQLVPKVWIKGLPNGVFLNINIPDSAVDSAYDVKITHQGCDLYNECFEKRRDPRNRVYYWQGYESQPNYSRSDSDGAVFSAGHISITPVRCDMTDYDMLDRLKTWDID
jgi:5'-nucleotidase